MADTLGLSVLNWSPLGGGLLTGKTLGGGKDGRVAAGTVGHFDKYKTDEAKRVAKAVVDVAKELNCSPGQLAIAWLRTRSPNNIPIVGARTAAHIIDNLKAVELTLSEDVLARLDGASRIELGFPSDFYPVGSSTWFSDWPPKLDARVRHGGRKVLGLPLK